MPENIEISRRWVEEMVIAQGLCPFAKLPFDQNRIRFSETEAKNAETILMTFWEEVIKLENTSIDKLSNSLLIISNSLFDFPDYLELYDLAEQLLVAQNRNHIYQLASFHPEYQFEGVDKNDVSNYTNRSPLPMIHILRIEEVSAAISSHPDIDSVPKNNEKKMHELGLDGIKLILAKIKK